MRSFFLIVLLWALPAAAADVNATQLPEPMPGISSIELKGNASGLATINAILAEKLAQDVSNANECRGESQESTYESATKLLAQAHGYLTIQTTSSIYCGGPYPSIAQTIAVYDAHDGAEIEIMDLLDENSAQDLSATSSIGQLIQKHYPREAEDECTPAVLENGNYFIWPEAETLALLPDLPHVVFACTEDIRIPYTELKGMLSAELTKRLNNPAQ